MFSPSNFFDLSKTDHDSFFDGDLDVWTFLPKIKTYLKALLEYNAPYKPSNTVSNKAFIGDDVYLEDDVIVEPNAVINGFAWIGKGTVIRSGAYIRGNVIIGKNSVIGNSTEIKNSFLFDSCAVPHFNYVGDSILGYKSHLGAGVICSNVRLDKKNIKVYKDGINIDTGLVKFGSIIGDGSEIGCNTVLNPGSILGKSVIIYPLSNFSGVLEGGEVGGRRKL